MTPTVIFVEQNYNHFLVPQPDLQASVNFSRSISGRAETAVVSGSPPEEMALRWRCGLLRHITMVSFVSALIFVLIRNPADAYKRV